MSYPFGDILKQLATLPTYCGEVLGNGNSLDRKIIGLIYNGWEDKFLNPRRNLVDLLLGG